MPTTTTTTTTLTTRRLFTAFALLVAFAVSATTSSQASAATPNAKAPHGAKQFKHALSKAEQHALRSAAKKLQSNKRDGLGTISVFCNPYQHAAWGYWIRCHVIYIGGLSGYTDWYEYDYWTGSQWAFWFDANN